MDWDYMGKLLLSVAVFAPGLFIFAGLLFLGVAMMIEKCVNALKK